MGFLDHFLNAADLLLKHQRHLDNQRAMEREEREPRKRKIKTPPPGQRVEREFSDGGEDPSCCIASRKLKR